MGLLEGEKDMDDKPLTLTWFWKKLFRGLLGRCGRAAEAIDDIISPLMEAITINRVETLKPIVD